MRFVAAGFFVKAYPAGPAASGTAPCVGARLHNQHTNDAHTFHVRAINGAKENDPAAEQPGR